MTILIVSFEARDHLLRCLRSIGAGVEVVVVDNASTDGSVAAVRAAFPSVTVIEAGDNLGFGRANNLGLRHVRGELVLLLNPDAELRAGALDAMAGVLARRRDVAAVGPRTRNDDLTPQLSFGPRLTLLSEWRQRRLVRGVRARDPRVLAQVEKLSAEPHEPEWLSASCLLVRRAALEAVGGFDEGFFLYEEDVDLCYRLRAAGWRLAYEPSAEVVHHLGRSAAGRPGRAALEYHRSHLRLYRKHNGPAAVLALRVLVATRGAAAMARAAARRDEAGRQQARATLRIALRG